MPIKTAQGGSRALSRKILSLRKGARSSPGWLGVVRCGPGSRALIGLQV